MPLSEYMRELRAKVGSRRLAVPSASALIFDEGRRLLLVRHVEGVWTTPGGAIEPDESPAQACVREAREETGLVVAPERIVGVYGGRDFLVRYGNGDETSYTNVVFGVRVVGGRLRPDGRETLDLRWFARGETPDPAPDWLSQILADAWLPAGPARFAWRS